MTRIAVVSNPRSQRNRRGMKALRAVLARHPEVLHAELGTITDLRKVFQDFAQRGIDHIVVNGGDGTVQATLTELINGAPFPKLPIISILPTGMTNLIAVDVGLKGRPDRALERLLAARGAGERRTRPLLSMSYDSDKPPVHGMFFGTGAFYHGTLLGREKVHPLGIERSAAAGLALGLFVARTICRRKGEDALFRGEPMAIAVDEHHCYEGNYFVLVATTLQRLLLGVMPFWGHGTGRIRYTSVAFPPRRFGRALLPALRGRPRPWMRDSGYISETADRIALRLACPVVFDGEFFSAGPGGVVTLSSERAVTFAGG